MIHDWVADGSPPVERSAAPEISQNSTVATAMPSTQPMANPTLVLPARLESSIRMTAMIGTGEIATPTESGSRSPISPPNPITRPFAVYCQHRTGDTRSHHPPGMTDRRGAAGDDGICLHPEGGHAWNPFLRCGRGWRCPAG